MSPKSWVFPLRCIATRHSFQEFKEELRALFPSTCKVAEERAGTIYLCLRTQHGALHTVGASVFEGKNVLPWLPEVEFDRWNGSSYEDLLWYSEPAETVTKQLLGG